MVVAVNADSERARLNFNLDNTGESLTDLITGEKVIYNSGIEMDGFRAYIFEV